MMMMYVCHAAHQGPGTAPQTPSDDKKEQ